MALPTALVALSALLYKVNTWKSGRLWKAVKKTSKNFIVAVDRYEGSPLYSPHNEGGDAASGRIVRPLSWLIELGIDV
ncbi:hypothetical protein CQZ93_12220 [Ochrobactrum vermis]|nr:hypothetical protein CQZ93_12220 [Ochrobactrum vermis]